MNRHVICALDMPDLDEAIAITKRLSPYIGAFKVPHALTLNYGLDVVDRLRDAGANRIFLDLKFHDIPNTVALAIREVCKRGVWMTTLHISGGPAMMTAAVEETLACDVDKRPLLIGVSVLTSLDQHILTDQLGVTRSLEDQMATMSQLAINCEMDGVVCSPHEIKLLRKTIGNRGVIVTPGIRLPNGDSHDQRRVGDAAQAIADGADYIVIGRALIQSPNVEEVLGQFGLVSA